MLYGSGSGSGSVCSSLSFDLLLLRLSPDDEDELELESFEAEVDDETVEAPVEELDLALESARLDELDEELLLEGSEDEDGRFEELDEEEDLDLLLPLELLLAFTSSSGDAFPSTESMFEQ